MKGWKNAMKLENIAAEFVDVGEDLQLDLSAVHVQVIQDCHDDGLEMDAYIFGKTEPGPNIPVVHIRIPASCGLMDEENLLPDGSVRPEAVIGIFDPEFISLLERKDICITWNAETPEQKQIRVMNPEAAIPLRPQYS